jgi:serine/threonine-protein kinase
VNERLKASEQIGARYRVVRFIAEGSSSDVYEARDLVSGRAVAIKLLHETGFDADDDPHLRCELEARVCDRLRSPYLVRVLDTGRLGDRRSFLVMELLTGATLKDRLNKHGRLTLPTVLEIGRQLFSALDAVHAGGVVHRDIKPRNIVLDERGGKLRIKLVDFGISELLGTPNQLESPSPDYAMGTPAYMAPEQLTGSTLDARADIYSAGVVLYEMITGRRPFEAADLDMLTRAILVEPVLPPSLLRPTCPLALEELVLRCFQRKPADRPHTARTVVEALTGVATAAPKSAVVSSAETPTMPPPAQHNAVTAKTRRVLGELPAQNATSTDAKNVRPLCSIERCLNSSLSGNE